MASKDRWIIVRTIVFGCLFSFMAVPIFGFIGCLGFLGQDWLDIGPGVIMVGLALVILSFFIGYKLAVSISIQTSKPSQTETERKDVNVPPDEGTR